MVYDLRNLAEKSDLSGSRLAKIIGKSRSHASNLLAGLRTLQEEDAAALDTRYETGDRYKIMLNWARKGHDTSWFGELMEYEKKANTIDIFENLTVPGLLQTPEYAHALIKAVGEIRNIDAEVSKRIERQKTLTRPDAPMVWVVVTESVIDWPIGGPDVMRRQLAHLLEVAEQPNVGLRVVERTAGEHAGVDGSFSVLSGSFGAVAYTESPGAGRLVTANDDVRYYQVRYNRIGQRASPENTLPDIIYRAMERL